MENKKNYSIIFIGIFNVLLFIAMITYICVYAYTNKIEMMDNGYNAHQQLLKAQNTRGSIYSRDGEILARTVTDDEGNEVREYPFGKVFSHVVGFASNGRSGIENYSNYYLINTSLSLSNKVKAHENEEKYMGDSVYTTLDSKLQQTAYEALAAHKGAVIVTEVKTGKVLCMVSKPDFDPNEITRIWDELTEDENNTQLLNRATQGLYPPGSTFKIVTALEYFRENGDGYKDFTFNCTGKFKSGDNIINCYHGENHGSLDFTKAFAKSCNSAFASMSLDFDRSEFERSLKGLMFGQELPWEFGYSKSTAICNDELPEGDMMQLAIGQGTTLVSPLHMNMLTMAIANDGALMQPYLVDSVQSDDGKVIKKYNPSKYKDLIKSEEAEFLQEQMKEVVETGTAKKLKGLSYTSAGKTGSAEFKDSTSDSHAWFTGFAPCEDPEIAVTIIVENAGSGGEYAVPIAKRIYDTYFGVD